jgi:hypothetical protein
MSRTIGILPGAVAFPAGVAAVMLTGGGRRDCSCVEPAAAQDLAPSTSQIVSAMEQLLSKTMSSLDERLTSQARSIDILKTTVAQTDSLLERVLESFDSLQTSSDESESALLQ